MISGKILRDAIISGANNINNQRSRVDELNVFPVPDGDTGTNMGMTVGAAVRELNALDDSCTVGEAAKTAASAMLRGARGNSGVITSLLFRGFSKALEGKKEADAADIVAALQKGVEGAYKAVMKPTEGTILTVARVAARKLPPAMPTMCPPCGTCADCRPESSGGHPQPAACAEKGRRCGRRRSGHHGHL